MNAVTDPNLNFKRTKKHQHLLLLYAHYQSYNTQAVNTIRHNWKLEIQDGNRQSNHKYLQTRKGGTN